MLITGVIVAIGIFGPALAFGIGAVFSNMYVTLEGKYIKIATTTTKKRKKTRQKPCAPEDQANE